MKFNTLSTTTTENLAGGEAFAESPKLELVSVLLSSFVEDQFYRSAGGTLNRVAELVPADPKFAAKAAVMARHDFGMRSISHAVAGEVVRNVKGEGWTARFVEQVVRRPDDMTEIVAYYLGRYGKPLPNSLKKGLAAAFGKFNAYQLGKYRGGRQAISLVDVANLVHPKPTDKNAEALHALVDGTLRSEETWEVELTRAGHADDVGAAKAQVWGSLIRERKLGYFALLRNLRNILEQAPDVVDAACAMLTDEELIRDSLVLPFRYQTAVAALDGPGTQKVIGAIGRAADIALANVPKLDGSTLVVLDCSGSMMGRPIEIGSLFAAVLAKACEADLMLFANDAAYVAFNPADTTLTLAHLLREKATYGGTNFHAPFQAASRPYDRIVILSDMQGWIGYHSPTSALAGYRERVGADPHVYSFDLQGYGTLQFPERHVYCLAGFSEKVFDVMALLEQDKRALIDRVEAVSL